MHYETLSLVPKNPKQWRRFTRKYIPARLGGVHQTNSHPPFNSRERQPRNLEEFGLDSRIEGPLRDRSNNRNETVSNERMAHQFRERSNNCRNQ